MRTNAKLLYAILFVITLSSTSFYNSDMLKRDLYAYGGWTKLGKHTVAEGVSFDELVLEEEKKDVKRLKLKVVKSSVYLTSIKIKYTDGTSETHRISRRLEKGDSTRVFDLIGHHRTLQKVFFIYRGGSNRGGAELVLLAKL